MDEQVADAALSQGSFDAYNGEIQHVALNATKLAAALPPDITFHRSIDQDFAGVIDACSENVLKLTNKLLAFSLSSEVLGSVRSKGKQKLEDQDDVVDRFSSVVIEVLDGLLEGADANLDTFLGRSKSAAIPIKPIPGPSKPVQSISSRNGPLDPSLLHASRLPKPQLLFKRKVDNYSWMPSLKHKYNAQIPLGHNLHDTDENDSYESQPGMWHPYRYELEHLNYPQHIFERRTATYPSLFEDTPFTWIDTKEGLDGLLDKLRTTREIAVDLEHHSYRTFSGFLCLMQISTRHEDFIVDTLALREELEDLNEIFTDPRIVKVFHGAESDIVWLQQDFNIYVVNLFDTFHASKVLGFPKHSLAALLAMYCDFIPDKRFQLADWRIRPLPAEMLSYARSDTHFLLYIYDNLCNALLEHALGGTESIYTVLNRSQETSLRTYNREVYDLENGTGPDGWKTLLQKWNKSVSGVQLAMFRCIHAWRDNLAREEDESTRYVLPNHYILQLTEHPPTNMTELLTIFRPVPPLIRVKAASLMDAMQAVVKDHSSNAGEACDEPQINLMKAAETKATTNVLINVADLDIASPMLDLWSRQHSSLTTTSSNLLGRNGETSNLSKNQPSVQCALFPSGWTSSAYKLSNKYRAAASRIHKSFLTTSITLPENIIDLMKRENDVICEQHGNRGSSIAEQPPLPIPPASQKQPSKAELEDSIVVVSQGKQKKRKRNKQVSDGNATETTSANTSSKRKAETVQDTNEETGTIVPFDYASAPNLLDESNHKGDANDKRPAKKIKRGQAFQYGDFPAPPRASSEVKGASKSITFR